MLKIITWNVNSIRMRLQAVETLLQKEQPDIVLIQELKTEDLSEDTFRAIGYQCFSWSQKAYNGVAVVSRLGVETEGVCKGFGVQSPQKNAQARYVEVCLPNIRLGPQEAALKIGSIYLPNGNPVDSPKFTYKKEWMANFYDYIKATRPAAKAFLLGGDFNIAPYPWDTYNPAYFEKDAVCHPESRAFWQTLLNEGFYDISDQLHPAQRQYTYWDYRHQSFVKNNGLRLDFFLASALVADCAISLDVLENYRALESPSDHAPLLLKLGTEGHRG